MKTTKHSTTAHDAPCPAVTASCQLQEKKSERTITKAVLICLALLVSGVANAANVPSGLTGLWRFQNSTDKLKATVGADLTTSNPGNSSFFLGPWTEIGIDSWLSKFSDGGSVQERSFDYLTVDPGFTPNGGGSKVNQYTVAIDYVQTSGPTSWNSLFQTAYDGNSTDGDLWIAGANATARTLYTTELGHSTLTFDPSKWHRIVWSVDNGNFFRVYVDGILFLDGAGQPIDGRYSLFPNRFHLFADNDWEDQWGLVGTVATWNRALTTAEIEGMGGWIGASVSPTPLILSEIPEIVSVSPADGETNVSPHFAYRAIILDTAGFINSASLQLLLDGAPVAAVVTDTGAAKSINFSSGGLLQSGSTHTYALTDGVNYTNQVTFQVQNYTSYEWRFTNGDLSAALGNGAMTYADEFGTPGITSFGTTDGSTVPHINGSPANYMHVPAFTLDTDGYWLTLNDSGPNVTSANINRYTFLVDVMVPSPWIQAFIVPFFNTGPYNLNDGDFYLAGDGRIGIGAGGYSVTNTVIPDTWYRIAFVADLKANTLTYYVNGTNVWSRAADGLDGRWSLYSNQDAGPDLLLFNEPTGTSTHELYVSSVAFADRVLSAAEIAALGGPSASGSLVQSFTPHPTLTSHASGSGVAISWPANYVGYALQSKTALAGSTWVPVPGVTNNSVTIPAGLGSQFFRLVQ